MRSSSLSAVILFSALMGIAVGVYSLYQANPALMPYVFFISVLGVLVRAVFVLREGKRRARPSGTVDFAALRSRDVGPMVPWLKEQLRGHDDIIDQVAGKLQRGLSLAAPRRTLGAFLIVGPTGTGKTFLAELIASALYPRSEPVILRMNQYKQPADVYTLIGPPPGQPGFEVGGALTRPVLENPYRVVVLDEIDKCHEDLRHCLYDVLDVGQCQEKSSGKMVYFNACVFFATCNAGVEGLRRVHASTKDSFSRLAKSRDVLSRDGGFDKAFLARFEDIILMDALSPIHVAEVACLQLAKYWRQYGIEVSYASPEILLEAMRRNTEFEEYGVRQLAHFIQNLTDPLIEEARQSGARRVRLGFDPGSGQLTLETGAEP